MSHEDMKGAFQGDKWKKNKGKSIQTGKHFRRITTNSV